jgi:hypothetical protein
MSGSIDKNASRALIAFIRSFTDLQEKHLEGILVTMREAIDAVMNGIQEISSRTATSKAKANEVLVSTYTNPDSEVKRSMDDVQAEVDRVLAQASGGDATPAAAPVAAPATTGDSEVARDALRRTAGMFSKHMEALETLDGQLQDQLIHMMGQLSRDDVIAQRIQHIMMAMQALQASLTYLLTDYENRCRPADVERFVSELKGYTFRSYTMDEERQAFYEAFPEERRLSKVS